MKPAFVDALRCPRCRGRLAAPTVRAEDAREIREGAVTCGGCAAEFPIQKGILHMLDGSDPVIASEIAGWEKLAGPLDESLQLTMSALPYYPHEPWMHVAPDFFQLFDDIDFSGKRVLDIGAGRTWSSRLLATIGRAGEVVAVDVLTKRFLGLETADFYMDAHAIFLERICCDLHQLPLRDGWAEAVISVASLHHSSDLPRLFAEVWRVLAPGGLFVFVSEPVKRASIPDRRPQNVETEHGINEHLYTYQEYLGPLRAQGFRCRHLLPRSVRYRLLYPDAAFVDGLPPPLRRLRKTRLGQRLIARALAAQTSGALLYRYSNLPLSVVARKPRRA